MGAEYIRGLARMTGEALDALFAMDVPLPNQVRVLHGILCWVRYERSIGMRSG